MKERAAVGTRWRKRQDETLWRVVQSHRVDRLAEIVPDVSSDIPAALKVYVPFDVLRRQFEEVVSP